MDSYEACWEDEENNRHIKMRIEFSRNSEAIHVNSITPEEVSFLCSETKLPLHSIRIHREKARNILLQQYHESGHAAGLDAEIQQHFAMA